MLDKLLQKDLNTRFFYGMIASVWAVVIFYAALFAFFEAWGASGVMLVGSFVIMPIVCLLEYKEKHLASRFVYNVSSAFYVFMAGLCFQFQDSSQYYYSCVVIGAMLIFPKKEKLTIFVALMTALTLWMTSKLIPMEVIPSIFLAKNAPIEFMKTINEIGSFFLTLVFIYMFVETIGRLKEETVIMNELVLRTEEDAKIGSWAFDTRNNSLKWSDQTYRIHEVEIGSELDVAKAINFYHPDDQGRITEYFTRAVESGVPYSDVFKIITKKGNQLWVRARGGVVRDEKGEIIEVSGSFQDITVEKKAEDAKDAFLATISHEMRTPLMSVIGLSDLLNESHLDKEQTEYTEAIIDGGNAVLTIINDILDLSKIKDNSLKINERNTNLNEVIMATCNVLEHSAKVKDIGFVFEGELDSPFIYCDPVRLRQVLTNLISNAIKFTDEGSVKVLVTEDEKKTDSSVYIFKVVDTGCGMSEEFVPKVFDEFIQEEQGENFYVGTGLGMSITKKLVEIMGGSIQVDSKKGEGTTVSFIVEFRHGAEIPVEKLEVKNVDLSHIHMLYADDNKINQKIVSKLLRSTDCKVSFADDGASALKKYKSDETFDIILMDMQMPIMDGIQATKEIREFERENQSKEIPILAFSAFSFEEDIAKAKEAGCQDYVHKPARKKELIQKILDWQRDKKAS